MPIRMRPLSDSIGVEILDIDLAAPVSDEAFGQIDAALDAHSLLLFRGQKFSETQHVDFSRRFGRLQDHVLKPYLMPGHPEILIISNIIEDGRPIGIGDAGLFWHSDTSYTANPCRCSLLYSREIPVADGDRSLGDTVFASLGAAYDALSDEMKRRLEPLQANHSYGKHYARMQAAGSKRPDLTEEQKREVPSIVHPAIRPHPITGRKVLFVNDGYTTHVLGLEQDESDRLLETLFQHCISPAFTYRHRWRVGDLLVWDNASSQHLAIADYALPQRRLMHRTTVLAA